MRHPGKKTGLGLVGFFGSAASLLELLAIGLLLESEVSLGNGDSELDGDALQQIDFLLRPRTPSLAGSIDEKHSVADALKGSSHREKFVFPNRRFRIKDLGSKRIRGWNRQVERLRLFVCSMFADGNQLRGTGVRSATTVG